MAKTPQELKIYEWQAKQIEDTLRMVANTLDSERQTTCLDRNVMQSWCMIKNVLAGKIDERCVYGKSNSITLH
jgi:hypothetical protein